MADLSDEEAAVGGGARRRSALRGSLLASATLLAVAAVRGVFDIWFLIAAVLAVAASAVVLADRGRPRPPRSAVPGDAAPGGLAEAVLANVPDPVILVDRRVLVLEANAAARRLLPALEVGHPLSFALRAPDVLRGIEDALRGGETVKVEYGERVPTERAFEVQIGPLREPGGEAGQPGVVLFFRDLTSARQLERMRVDFVANASHELRTPLASLLGFIETLQGSARNDAAARGRFLEIMRGQAQRMTRLIDDLLSLSRIEMRAHLPPDKAIDLVPLLRQVVDALSPLVRERGATVALSLPEAPLVVLGDRDELMRVCENLIENAVKYGHDGGRVDVGLSRRAEGEAELIVRDDGPGIAPEHLPRLTERFYRVDAAKSRETGGTGLGLAIVKHILARHRGQLAIESEPGRGATFSVILPEVPADATA